jgi:hypothetical protein
MVELPHAGHAVAAVVHAAGGTAAFLTALRTHAASVSVQHAGFAALGGVLDVVGAILTRDAAEDGIRITVAALRRHVGNAGMMVKACYTLFALLISPDAKAAALAAGAVPAIAAAMEAHAADAPVQVNGLDVLSCMLQHLTPTPRNTAIDDDVAGVLHVVIAALRAHAGTPQVQEKGCLVLALCLQGNTATVQSAVGAAGGVEAAIAALAAHPGASVVQKNGLMALAGALGHRLPPHLANVRRAQAAGGVQGVVRAIRGTARFPGEDGEVVLLPCYLALDALLPDGGEAGAAAVRAGALEAVGETARSELLALRHGIVAAKLRAAAAQHDGAACAHAAGCARCATLRARGEACALPSCGARGRAEGGGKKLLRCGTCRAECYCSPAHQREDWGRHKPGCRAAGAEAAG